MADEYIKKGDAINKIKLEMDMQDLYLPIHFIEFVLNAIPSADVAPVVHGKWIFDDPKRFITHCSNCNWVNVHYAWHYCPHCGADMRGKYDG